MIDGITDRGAKIMANRTLAHLKRLFRWAAARDIIESDPAAHVEKPTLETRRERLLADDELATMWSVAGAMGFPFGPAVQLLVLTLQDGKRSSGSPGAKWIWTAPGSGFRPTG